MDRRSFLAATAAAPSLSTLAQASDDGKQPLEELVLDYDLVKFTNPAKSRGVGICMSEVGIPWLTVRGIAKSWIRFWDRMKTVDVIDVAFMEELYAAVKPSDTMLKIWEVDKDLVTRAVAEASKVAGRAYCDLNTFQKAPGPKAIEICALFRAHPNGEAKQGSLVARVEKLRRKGEIH